MRSIDLLAGHVQMMFNDPVSALPLVGAGRLRALATTGLARTAITGEILTMARSKQLPAVMQADLGKWIKVIRAANITPN